MADGKELPAQLLFSDGLAPEEVLVALRQAEGVAITLVVESAEQRGREQCAEPIPPPE